jgi:hypothetical protein
MSQRRTPASGWLCELGVAGLTSGFALACYLHTLAPGLVAIRDTPAFQYVGRILGVPHQPGYPLYVLVTHLFSFLPVGSLAYRMNLFSAVAGATAVGLLYVVFRQMRAPRPVAAAFAAAFGLGPLVWSQTIIAEVYSLESALIAAAIAALLRWRHHKATRWFGTAAFLWGLVFAHHTSDLLLLPGVIGFVWAADRSWLQAPRRLALAVGLVILAFVPYLLVVVRTVQGAAYVLEPAHGLSDLVRIAAGAGYRENLFPFSAGELLRERLPLAFSVVRGDLPPPALALVVLGLIVLARRDRPMAAFLTTGIVAQFVFVINYDIPDIAVFFIPAVLLLWTCAAAGAAALYERAPGIPAAMVVIAIPLWSAWHHADIVDQSWNTGTAAYMRALVHDLPPRSTFLGENWVADQLVRYVALGEGLPDGKTLRGPVSAGDTHLWVDQHDAVFAFAQTAARQRVRGHRFVREWIRVPLAAWVEAKPPGTIIAIAAPAAASAEATADALGLRFLDAAGRPRGTWSPLAVIGRRSGKGAAVSTARPSAEVSTTMGDRTAAITVVARAHARSADVLVNGQTLVTQDDGVVASAWSPAGELRDAVVASRTSGLSVVDDALQLYRQAGPRRCVVLASGERRETSDLAEAAMLAIDVPPGARLQMEALGLARWAVRLVDAERGAVLRVQAGAETGASAGTIVADQAGTEGGWALLALGAKAGPLVFSLVSPTAGARATACAVPLDMSVRPAGEGWVLGMANDQQQDSLGAGWEARAESSPWGPVRRTTDAEASVVVDLPDAPGWRVSVTAWADPSRGAGARVGLRPARGDVIWQPAKPGWNDYDWPVDDPATLESGELTIVARTSAGAWLPLLIRQITFTPR